jgi:hypothetical protein
MFPRLTFLLLIFSLVTACLKAFPVGEEKRDSRETSSADSSHAKIRDHYDPNNNDESSAIQRGAFQGIQERLNTTPPQVEPLISLIDLLLETYHFDIDQSNEAFLIISENKISFSQDSSKLPSQEENQKISNLIKETLRFCYGNQTLGEETEKLLIKLDDPENKTEPITRGNLSNFLKTLTNLNEEIEQRLLDKKNQLSISSFERPESPPTSKEHTFQQSTKNILTKIGLIRIALLAGEVGSHLSSPSGLFMASHILLSSFEKKDYFLPKLGCIAFSSRIGAAIGAFTGLWLSSLITPDTAKREAIIDMGSTIGSILVGASSNCFLNPSSEQVTHTAIAGSIFGNWFGNFNPSVHGAFTAAYFASRFAYHRFFLSPSTSQEKLNKEWLQQRRESTISRKKD